MDYDTWPVPEMQDREQEADYLRNKTIELLEEIGNVRKLRLIYDFVENQV
jgi:hypothetical protein